MSSDTQHGSLPDLIAGFRLEFHIVGTDTKLCSLADWTPVGVLAAIFTIKFKDVITPARYSRPNVQGRPE
jgi:hypothetical protein